MQHQLYILGTTKPFSDTHNSLSFKWGDSGNEAVKVVHFGLSALSTYIYVYPSWSSCLISSALIGPEQPCDSWIKWFTPVQKWEAWSETVILLLLYYYYYYYYYYYCCCCCCCCHYYYYYYYYYYFYCWSLSAKKIASWTIARHLSPSFASIIASSNVWKFFSFNCAFSLNVSCLRNLYIIDASHLKAKSTARTPTAEKI